MRPDDGASVVDDDKVRILSDVMQRSALFNPRVGRPYKYEAAEVRQRIEDYFGDCLAKSRRPTLTGLSLALDITMMTLRSWTENSSMPHHEIVNQARLLIQTFEEDMALENKTNTIYAIFRDKSRWGYVEKQQLEVLPPPDPLALTRSTPEERQRYLEELRAQFPIDDYDEPEQTDTNE